jgi:hypothetical protein
MVFLMAAGTRAGKSEPLPINDPKVIAAMKEVWMRSSNGTTGIESTFRLDGNPSDFEVVTSLPTNQFMSQRVAIIPGRTFAVFHVHPTRGDARPSRTDRALADRYGLKMVTIHICGVFEYDPVERKTVKVRDGLAWSSPSKTGPAGSYAYLAASR